MLNGKECVGVTCVLTARSPEKVNYSFTYINFTPALCSECFTSTALGVKRIITQRRDERKAVQGDEEQPYSVDSVSVDSNKRGLFKCYPIRKLKPVKKLLILNETLYFDNDYILIDQGREPTGSQNTCAVEVCYPRSCWSSPPCSYEKGSFLFLASFGVFIRTDVG